MNLRLEIRPELWASVSSQYEQEHYSDAILSALHHLRDVLRDTANLDGDGAALVGQALGGSPPILRINKFETESDKNEQKGFEDIVRGLFRGIRNPRTHDKVEDTKETADAIIVFINHCLNLIQGSKGPFVLEEWVNRVFDPDFVPSERYAELLVQEVPPKRHNEALLKVYKNKTSGDGRNLRLVFYELIKVVGDERLGELLAVVSEELKTTLDEVAIRLAIQVLPGRLWPLVDEAARLRVENRLMRSIKEGRTRSSGRRTEAGGLGTWAINIIDYFTLKNQLHKVLLEKMESNEMSQQDYVAQFFWDELPFFSNFSMSIYFRDRWIASISTAVAGDPWSADIVREKLLSSFHRFPSTWQDIFLERLKSLEMEDTEFYADLVSNKDEDIPF